ncbi:hypothetical protein [Shimia thalassica]|uniref:hypothetical protein n=1 Tax=Shimia thalassica TaxID=1715693 RepID=UPI0026E219EB|nr:hypothetical protein [Shimia thalassica]MDO6483072.1 hypothetical protein [Shimia thalassica]
MQFPNEQHISEAREVLRHPERHTDDLTALRNAWAIQKQARGQRVNFKRIGPANYEIGADPMLDPSLSLVHSKPACACPLAYLTKGGDAA